VRVPRGNLHSVILGRPPQARSRASLMRYGGPQDDGQQQPPARHTSSCPARATSSRPAQATSSRPARATSSCPARATSSRHARATSSRPARATSSRPAQRGGGTIRSAQREGWWEGRPLHHTSCGPPPPLRFAARGRKKNFVLAMQPHPSFAKKPRARKTHDPEKWCPVFGPRSCATKKEGGGAPKGACHPLSVPIRHGSAPRTIRSHGPSVSGALAFRRSTAALAGTSERSSSAQAALHAKCSTRALPAPSSALKQGTLRAGRNAGGA
jgi:hypothetical protein